MTSDIIAEIRDGVGFVVVVLGYMVMVYGIAVLLGVL